MPVILYGCGYFSLASGFPVLFRLDAHAQLNRIADQLGKRIHSEIRSIDAGGRLDEDIFSFTDLAVPAAAQLHFEDHSFRDTVQREISLQYRPGWAGPFEISADEKDFRIICNVKEACASDQVFDQGSLGIQAVGPDNDHRLTGLTRFGKQRYTTLEIPKVTFDSLECAVHTKSNLRG